MSLVGKVGRKRFRARVAMTVVYLVLLVGAVTTVYPFLLMMVTGLKGPTDQNDNKLVPAYFSDLDGKDEKTGALSDSSLLGKYLIDKYAGDKSQISSTRTGAEAPVGLVEDYEKFLEGLPVDYWSAGFRTAPGQVTGRLSVMYREWLKKRYKTVDDVNRAYIEENVAFQTVVPPAELLERPNWKQPDNPKYREWREFKETLPAEFRIPVRETRLWQEFLRTTYKNQFADVPADLAGEAKAFEELKLPSEHKMLTEFWSKGVPDRYALGAAEAKWAEATLQEQLKRLEAERADLVTEFTNESSSRSLPQQLASGRRQMIDAQIREIKERLAKEPEAPATGFEVQREMPTPPPPVDMPTEKGDTSSVIKVVPTPTKPVPMPVITQIAHLYELNQDMPIQAFEEFHVKTNAALVTRGFAGRNYGYVFDFAAVNGRALWNTVLFCALAMLTQLTVNPLAAYALSRYPIRASGKILIFLLATMAFPAEVAMIPSFLLLKDLGLLNTFAALVLPTAASGYMIFLLKGFFDSLPQELFEAGQLDGAKETTMMMRIALPLSKPVLGYLALIAFMGAYGAFLYAFLVVQDQRMWTLMVWIYQLQQSAPRAVVMAALTLAAVPTLIVFLFAQRTIMRGIVLPSER